jgi:hypothetical protein
VNPGRSTSFLRALEGALVIVACITGTLLTVSFLSSYSVGRGDVFVRSAVVAATSIVILGTWWCHKRARSMTEMAGSLLIVELPIGWLVLYFVGSYPPDSVSLHWFLFVNLTVAVPWIVAMTLGWKLSRQPR